MAYPIPSPSGPSYNSTSPLRSSPLSNPPVYSPSRTPSPSAKPRPIPNRQNRRLSALSSITPTRPSQTPSQPHTPADNEPILPTSTPSPPLSRSHPLLGSYPLSLLHSRMSHAHTPHSVPSTSSSGFAIHIGAVGKGRNCSPELKRPEQLVLGFEARYYDLDDPSTGSRGATTSPWVGTADLEDHYTGKFSKAGDLELGLGKNGIRTVSPPFHPGYQVAQVGQLQIIVKTVKSPLKAFIIPYDLRGLQPGGRLLVRERTYVTAPQYTSSIYGSPRTGRGESLRYAIQLQFTCVDASQPSSHPFDPATTRSRRYTAPPSSRPDQPDTYAHPKKLYYLSKSIKVVFTSSPLELDETLRAERTDEVIQPSGDAGSVGRVIGFSPGSRPRREEWDVIRAKWFARRQVEHELSDTNLAPDPFIIPSPSSIEIAIPPATSPSFPKSPLQPIPTSIPILSPTPILSPLPRLPIPSNPPPPLSRPSTPTRSQSPRPPSVKTPTPSRLHRQRPRRGSGSYEERELSEKLRALKLGDRGHDNDNEINDAV